MALDFGILQPANISGQLQAGQESAMRNQLAQQQLAAGQQQMETGRMQQEKAGLEMQQFRRRQSALDKFLSDAEKGGHTGDPEDVAKSFYDFAITSGDPSVVLAAQQALMAAKERKQYLSERMPGGAPAPNVVSRNEGAPQGIVSKPFTPEQVLEEERRWAQMAMGGSTKGLAPMLDSKGNLLNPMTPERRALDEQRLQQMADGTAGMAMPAVTGRPIQPEQALNVVSRSEGSPSPIPTANMLAPAAAPATNMLAPPPAAPANALAAPGMSAEEQRARYPSGAAKTEIGMLTKQLEAMQKLHVVGDSLLNGAGQVVATVPKKATLSDFERILETSGLTPTQQTQAKQEWLKKQITHAPGTSVTVVGEKAEEGEFRKLLVSQFADLSKAANLASKTLPSIDANLNLLNKGFETGFGTESKAAGAKLLAALGVDSAEQFATNAQVFQAKAAEAVLQKQLEQKGPQTQSDRELIEKTGAQLGATSQGNKFLLTVAKEQLKRDIEQRDFYANWREKNKTFSGAENAWFAGEGAKSLFDRPGLKTYLNPTSAASMIPGQGSAAPAARTVVRTGTLNGRRVIQYSDGSTEYGN